MKKFYAVANFIIVVAMVSWNGWVGANGLAGKTVGGLSDAYSNLFTPAGYAFSIWGVIFLALIALSIFQLKKVFVDKESDDFVSDIGPSFMIANIGNAAWLWFWLNEQTGISVIIMLVILLALASCIIKLDIGRKKVTSATRLLVWGPIAIYSGWITVATIANISAYLAKINWLALLSETQWTIVMMSAATIVNLLIIRYRKMPAFALVGVWALLAISMRHWGRIPILQWSAILFCAILVAAVLGIFFRKVK